MANLIVSPVIDLVIQKVAAFLDDRIEQHSGVEGKLKELEAVLNRIQPVANTADDVDLEKHKDLKPWMRDLKLAAEEANDVLDVFEYLHLKRQAEGDGSVSRGDVSSPSKRLKSIIPSSLYNYAKKITPSAYPLERLGSIQNKLEELDSRAVQFLLVVTDRKATDRVHHNQDVRKRETSSSVVDPGLVGRKELLEEIISKLIEEEEEEEEHITVIPVVGHGGMGKTTLAQHIFNNTRVESHFQVRMWAHVSQDFDVWTLTKKITESATRTEKCADTDSLETLQQKLKDALKSKRFLLVLDDVWYDGQNRFVMEEEWNKLCSPMAKAGGKGSKILLTSRTPEVKDLPSDALKSAMIYLQELAQDECWSIIQTSVFRGNGIPDVCLDLVPIGRQIALKVRGSPLAAKAVGGILRKELSWRHWSNILKTELSKLPGNGVMPVLRLSYQYLPSHLRQCFAYCSLFPKGHIYNVDMLVRMWVAHGYIRDRPYGEMTEEDMGKSYFHDLLSAGFFTKQIVHGRKSTVMHDLMNDLAGFVTKDEIIRIENTQNCPIPKTIRHLSISTDYLAELNKIRCNVSDLETFLLLRSSGGGDCVDRNDKLVKEVVQELRRVRVLDLSWCKVKELPEDISNCVHLRYLNLSGTQIGRFPDPLWRLYHLQVLCISETVGQRNFEICSLEKLTNLLKLRFVSTSLWLFVDLAFIKGLKYIQVAENLGVQEGRGSEIANLKALDDLGGSLRLDGLQYIESRDAAREADLCGKKRLLLLDLIWGGHCNPDVATEVLEGLQPPSSLEELRIRNYPGEVCPNWVSIPSLQNLKSIYLLNLIHLECLPPLGQQLPFLRSLSLRLLPRVRKLSLYGFSSLNNIEIDSMEELEEWSAPDGTGVLPCLKSFKITNCPKMRVLPALSHTVTYLEIRAVGISSLPELVHQPIANSGSSGSSSSSSSSFSSELSELYIVDCGNLTSLDSGLLQNKRLKLVTIMIWRCELLVSLPDGGFRELNSLKSLTIEDCPNLTWPASRQDVDCGLLPTSLEHLTISHIDGKVLSGYLHGLSSLSTLSIYSCEALTPSELEEGLHALPSLKVLTITDCPGLLVETSSILAPDDSEGMAIRPVPLGLDRLEIDDPLVLVNVLFLKSLTSVQQLYISDASRLISFSLELEEWLLQNGTALTILEIIKAEQLQSLPKLPNSLEILHINNTNEEFKKRYERDTGCDWYKIRHIKHIYFR